MPIFLIGMDQTAGAIHFGDRVAWIWRSNAHHNLLLIALIAAAILLIRYAARQEYWRNAARQVRGRRLAMVSFAILSVYVLAGLLDSIRWGDPVLNPDGKLVRNEVGGLIYSPRRLSLLDRVCTPLREKAEKTYSAPLCNPPLRQKHNPTTGWTRLPRVSGTATPTFTPLWDGQGRHRCLLPRTERDSDSVNHRWVHNADRDSVRALFRRGRWLFRRSG